MNRVRLGLIGLGEWPRQAYVPILQELEAAEVVAVAARTAVTRDWAREQFGPRIAVYADYQDLLRDPNVEAVMLALPNHLHDQGMTLALDSGKHLFYEPPLAHRVEELRVAIAAMAASQRVIQCDLELRYLPVIRAARRLLADGTIGDPLMAKIRLWCNWGFGGGKWTQFEEEGFFPWLGCWYLDVLDCVFGAAPERASVTGGQAANGRLTDHGWATLEYPGARIGLFEFNLVAVDGLDIRLSALGTRGELEADLCSGDLRWRAVDRAWQQSAHPASQPAHGFAGMRECIAGFLDAIRHGRRPDADVEVAQRVHAAMLACAQADKENRASRPSPP